MAHQLVQAPGDTDSEYTGSASIPSQDRHWRSTGWYLEPPLATADTQALTRTMPQRRILDFLLYILKCQLLLQLG